MEFLRQLELFNPGDFNTPVHIIGAGATGSWLTLLLTKIGVSDITVYDFDVIEDHNLPNQFFPLKAVGKYKVDALRREVQHQTGITIKTQNIEVTGDTPLEGIVFVLTDSMKSRSEIFKKAIKNNPSVQMMVETRMGLEHGRIYCINPTDKTQVERYEATLYSDEDAEVSACGASQSVAITAVGIAQLASWKLVKYHKGEHINNEILIDYTSTTVITTEFK